VPPPTRWARLSRQGRRPLIWLTATAGAAIAGLVATLVSQAGAPLVEAVSGDPIRATVAGSESMGGYALPHASVAVADRSLTIEEIPAYLTERGAVPVAELRTVLVLEGHKSGGIRITRIRPVVVRRSETLSGTYISCCVYGAGPIDPLEMEVAMDAAAPALRLDGKPYFPGKNIDLSLNERITLNLSFTARRHTYSWYMEVAYISAGHAEVMRISDTAGRPFTLTAMAKRYTSRFVKDQHEPGIFTRVRGHAKASS
jgi:hypothetical protein